MNRRAPAPLSDETLMAIWDATATQDDRVLAFGRAVADERPISEPMTVLTYKNQPDNVGAWRLGEACRIAADASAGDYIDRGLLLSRELQAKGYGVVVIHVPQTPEKGV